MQQIQKQIIRAAVITDHRCGIAFNVAAYDDDTADVREAKSGQLVMRFARDRGPFAYRVSVFTPIDDGVAYYIYALGGTDDDDDEFAVRDMSTQDGDESGIEILHGVTSPFDALVRVAETHINNTLCSVPGDIAALFGTSSSIALVLGDFEGEDEDASFEGIEICRCRESDGTVLPSIENATVTIDGDSFHESFVFNVTTNGVVNSFPLDKRELMVALSKAL